MGRLIVIMFTVFIVCVKFIVFCENKSNTTWTRKSFNISLLNKLNLNTTLRKKYGRKSMVNNNMSAIALVNKTSNTSISNKPCFKKRRKIEEEKKRLGNTMADLIPPSCDPFGYFTHVQCRAGGPCFCVDKLNGKPLNSKKYYVSWLPENACAAQAN